VLVVVGRIGRAHGIRGELSVDPRTDFPELRFAVGARLHTDAGTLTVLAARPHGARWLVTFRDIGDRTAAERLAGTVLSAEVDDDESLEGDEYFDRQLIGLDVESAGKVIGTVCAVRHGSAQDTLEIHTDGRRVRVPFVAALVEVDLSANRLIVTDRPGLLDPRGAAEAR
jgi:16S rRNA processing protein RimM